MDMQVLIIFIKKAFWYIFGRNTYILYISLLFAIKETLYSPSTQTGLPGVLGFDTWKLLMTTGTPGDAC